MDETLEVENSVAMDKDCSAHAEANLMQKASAMYDSQ